MRVFAFLDRKFTPAVWAVMRGLLISTEHVHPTDARSFVSFMLAGMIISQNNSRLYNEYIIEHVRASLFTDCVSRLRWLYVFNSRAHAESRIGDREWPPYFRSENLLELELDATAVTKVDSDWITKAPRGSDGRVDLNQIDWISKYWRGEPRTATPTWELIAQGVAVVLDEKVRRECWDLVITSFPYAEISALMARLAGEAGTRGGHIHPFLLRKNESEVMLEYLVSDSEFHDPIVIQKIASHPDSRRLGMAGESTTNMATAGFSSVGMLFHPQHQTS
jgi:hypothetical protein